MRRAVFLVMPLLLVATEPALSEGGPLLLRGMLPEGEAAGAKAEETVVMTGAAGLSGVLPPPATDEELQGDLATGAIPDPDPAVFALRTYTVPQAEEAGTRPAAGLATATGLSGSGRVVPVARFSERVQRVERQQGLGGSPADSGIFDGETRFDAAEGLRIGSFTVFPEVSLRGGVSDNVDSSVAGEAGSFSVLEPSVTARSNWSRHELSLQASGSLTTYSGGQDPDPSAAARAGLRLDIAPGLTGNGGLAYSYAQESSSTAESAGGADDVHQVTADIGLARDLGLVTASGTLGAVRSLYSGGGAASSDRDNTLYNAGLRLSANTDAVFRPFIAGDLLLRRHDGDCAGTCDQRDSVGYDLRLGTRIDNGSKLSGDVAAGWRSEHLDDATLGELNGPVAAANLVWSPTRRTTVTGGLATSFEPTSLSGSAGSIIHSADVRLAHDFGDRLAGEVGAGVSRRSYEGLGIEETTVTGLAGLTFALTRNAALKAQYTYTAFSSSEAGRDYDENSIEAGVRIRR